VPWLEPDINDCLTELAQAGSKAVVIVPIGFVSDHMEVIFDLDVEAAQTARELGLPMARAATPGTDTRFVAMISSLAAAFASGRPADVPGGEAGSLCTSGCCVRGSQSASRPGQGR
jgi:protoporphyrin/coproporphyrin ferrochelatase